VLLLKVDALLRLLNSTPFHQVRGRRRHMLHVQVGCRCNLNWDTWLRWIAILLDMGAVCVQPPPAFCTNHCCMLPGGCPCVMPSCATETARCTITQAAAHPHLRLSTLPVQQQEHPSLTEATGGLFLSTPCGSYWLGHVL
jgi:hypothetical protein